MAAARIVFILSLSFEDGTVDRYCGVVFGFARSEVFPSPTTVVMRMSVICSL